MPALSIKILRPLFRLVTYRNLVPGGPEADPDGLRTFTRAEADELLQQAWRIFDRLAPGLPRQPTAGSRLSLQLACLTLAFYQALLEKGVDRQKAIRLVSNGSWLVYEYVGRLWYFIARLLSRDPLRRLRICTNLFRRFPFNPPGWVMVDLPQTAEVAFDVSRCPVAELFRAHGEPELCVESWCNQDYRLARLWGGWLERSGTLVDGAPCCDFRWLVSTQRPR